MGVLEILLIIAVALKMAGVAFAATSYWALIGYYGLGVGLVFASMFALLGTLQLLRK